MAQRCWQWGSLLAVLLAAPLAQAQDKPKEAAKSPPPKVQPLPEADFLEFLASWDSEDEEWSEYLAAHMEEARLAKAKAAVPQEVKKVDRQ